jgi:hypothetical protein
MNDAPLGLEIYCWQAAAITALIRGIFFQMKLLYL